MDEFSKAVANRTHKKMADPILRDRALNYLIEDRLYKESRWELINECRRALEFLEDYKEPNLFVSLFRKFFKGSK